jgi:GTP cyclohydrolase I
MDAIIHPLKSNGFIKREIQTDVRPSRAEVEQAVRTLIRWTGDSPTRDGLIETPSRVAKAYEDLFSGYSEDPEEVLRKTFDETEGYDEAITMRGIRFVSHCEHHIAPIIGKAWISYVPTDRVVGISKLARVLEIYAKRLQIQERLTSQVANVIDDVLQPKGVAVLIKAQHMCVGMRGVRKHETDLVTTRMLGCFRDDPVLRQEFMAMVD